MKKIIYPCYCGGKLTWKHERVVQDGIDCGVLAIELCNACKSTFLPEESMRIVEEKLKEKGLWGVKRKAIKFWKSGNSITIRLPVDIVREMDLKKVEHGFVYKDGEHKLAIEF